MDDLGEFEIVSEAAARIEIGDVAAGDERPLAGAGDAR